MREKRTGFASTFFASDIRPCIGNSWLPEATTLPAASRKRT